MEWEERWDLKSFRSKWRRTLARVLELQPTEIDDWSLEETTQTVVRDAEAHLRAALQAVRDDPMGCHSIAVWEQVNEALRECS